MKEKRKLTMLHARGYDYDRNVPSVSLSGLWLKDCGFAPGDRVTVEKMEDGKIVITKVGTVADGQLDVVST